MSKELKQIRARVRQFKRLGYDIEASRKYLLGQSGIRDGSILEVGTGKGHLAVVFAAKGFSMTSVDLDPKQLSVARSYLKSSGVLKRVSLRKANAERLPFGTGAFDAVVSIDFFHHAKSPLKCLKEMMRVVRHTLVIADFNERGKKIMAKVHRDEGKHHPESRIPFGELKAALLKGGFEVKTYRRQCHTYFIAQRRKGTL